MIKIRNRSEVIDLDKTLQIVKMKSPYTLIYVLSLLGQGSMCFLSSARLVEHGVSLTNVTNCLFYSSAFVSSLILGNIARKWPDIIKKVEEIEQTLPPFERNIAKYCNMTALFILTAAVLEHSFSLYFGVAVTRLCEDKNISGSLFYYYMPWIFEYTPYYMWKGLIAETFNLQSTLMWSFNDLLIMVLSIYITEHFSHHAHLLKSSVNQDHFCCNVFRTQYLKIVRLLELINHKFGIYILTSFSTNLFWICVTLFYTLNKNQLGPYVACPRLLADMHYRYTNSLEHSIYFTFSFTFVLMRTVLVLLLAARVHSASIKPLPMLYEIPSSNFTVDVKRYIDQINNLKVALTGLDFFYVTKTMILSLAGTIVTYELVLLQFNKESK